MEGRGLLRGAILLVALSLVRILLSEIRDPDPVSVDGADRLPTLLAEAQATRDEQQRRAEPLEDGETVDPNRSPEEELDRLPGVGTQVAGAITRFRAEKGGFRRPEDLLEVPGIGPATLARIRPYLDFSRGVPLELRAGGGSPDHLDLNRAGMEELQELPGIGPALAGRILESRSREGPFEKVEDLLRVPGIGPAKLARLRPLVLVAR
jgi:competence ComEA-like helix-hairpin-helix protein